MWDEKAVKGKSQAAILTPSDFPFARDGILADVAPTVLDLMGIEKPAEMTGSSLIS